MCHVIMKNLFAIHKNEVDNHYQRFIVKQLSEEGIAQAEGLLKEGQELNKKKNGFVWLGGVSVLLMVAGASLTLMYIFYSKEGFLTALKERPAMFIISVAALLIGIVMQIIYRVLLHKRKDDPEVKDYVEKADRIAKQGEDELLIPSDALKIDVIAPLMKKNKKGEDRLTSSGLIQFINQAFKVYVDGDALCFADPTMVIAIPLSSIQGVTEITKRIPLSRWNKKEHFNSPRYKAYGVYTNQTGFIWIKNYFSINCSIEDEDYCVWIPCYDFDVIKPLLGEVVVRVEKQGWM